MTTSRGPFATRIGLVAGLGLLTGPAAAYADAGVPMLALMAIPMWASLLVIIPLEAFLVRRYVQLGWGRSLKVSAAANFASTVVGVPLTWILLVAGEMALNVLLPDLRPGLPPPLGPWAAKALFFMRTGPWLYPVESALYWMMPAAALILLVPFFFVSVWIEYRVARRMLAPDRVRSILGWAWRANAASYALMALVPAVWLGHNLIQHHRVANDDAHRPVDQVSAERLWELAVARVSRSESGPVPTWRGETAGQEHHGTAADSLWHAGCEAERVGDVRTAGLRWRAALDELDRGRARVGYPKRAEVSTGVLLGNLAKLECDQGRYAEAIPLYERLVDECATYPPGLAAAYDSVGLPERAEDYCRRVMNRATSRSGAYSEVIWAATDLASHRLARGDSANAEEYYRRAIQVTAENPWDEGPALQDARHGLARLYRAQHRLLEAETLLEEGIRRSSWGRGEFADSTNSGPFFLDLGLVFLDQGALPQAAHCIKSALRWDSRLRETAEAYALLLEREGRVTEAKAWRDRSRTAPR